MLPASTDNPKYIEKVSKPGPDAVAPDLEGNKTKLTVIMRMLGAGEMSRRTVLLAMKEAAAAGVPFDVVLWGTGAADNASLLDQLSGPAPCEVRLEEGSIDAFSLRGEYFCVVDDGDYWEEGSLAKLLRYLEACMSDTDIAFAYRRMAKSKKRLLAYRRIAKMPPESVCLDEQFERINTLYKGALIRTEAVRGAVPSLSAGGESELLCVTAAVLRRMRYDIVSAAVIRYIELREYGREKAGEGTVRAVFDIARRICGFVPRYAQSVALECLYFSFIRNKTDLSLLSDIDVDVIRRSDINRKAKEYMYREKYGEDAMRSVRVGNEGTVQVNGYIIADIVNGEGIAVSVLDIREGHLVIDGLVLNSVISSGRLFVTDDKGGESECRIMPHPPEDVETAWGKKIAVGERYSVSVRLRKGGVYRFVFDDGHGARVNLTPLMGSHSRLNHESGYSYFVKGGYRISFSKKALRVASSTRVGDLKAEMKYLAEIARKREFGVFLYRLMYRAAKAFKRRPVWLVGDRPQYAKDNAEHLFRYMMKEGLGQKYNIRFVISRGSRDYSRMRSYGRVLPFDTATHRIMFLLSDKVILSTAHDMGVNPFSASSMYYRDLYSFDYVYLRHGVAKDDQSAWLNKLNKNIRILLTVSARERHAILNGDYCYDETVVKLTGLPRFDSLTDDAHKVIAILPTWRRNLEGKMVKASPVRQYRKDFKESEFFDFYNRLINDEELLAVMRAEHYSGKFFLHPVFEAQAGDFVGNDVFSVGSSVADYQQLFRESSLMLTDFSSVAFDFAYLKKPLIYAQPDEDEFYVKHAWKRGYFSYPKDGFGPVTRSYEETVRTMINYIKGGCVMEKLYSDRVDGFFTYRDQDNCRRVMEAIEAIDKN
jgi:CDP-glycerol glycerophosphotransferase (TagB/SpsB family)